MQKQIAVVSNAASKNHIIENIEIFDFELSNADFERLDNLRRDRGYCEEEISDFNYE